MQAGSCRSLPAIWKSGGYFLLFVVYFHDILLFSKTNEALERVMDYFKKSFKVRIYRMIEKFLGFSV